MVREETVGHFRLGERENVSLQATAKEDKIKMRDAMFVGSISVVGGRLLLPASLRYR